MSVPARPLAERIWAKVRYGGTTPATADCWEWTGALTRGYPSVKGPDRRTLYAHRAVYELLVGPIPKGLNIDHLCRNPRCVNPAHLEAVTQSVNVRRGVSPAATRARQTQCKRGHDFTPENTILRGIWRTCRECTRMRKRASWRSTIRSLAALERGEGVAW